MTKLLAGAPGSLSRLPYRFCWGYGRNLLGMWVTTLQDGRHVTLQFDGASQGGTYRQLIRWEDVVVREFGHWAFSVAGLRLTMTVSGLRAHPYFGVTTGYEVLFRGRTRIVIDGPGKAKWSLRKAPGIPALYSLLSK